ncbi:hypothetical protein [Pseudoalteromonas sp. DL-6]|uniref:lipopolysaccharide biosynthesis protein n=1 Tax=Pseudoalteromonas sp. DL-6 TaxID=1390185 RepID=UPI00103B518E|nr:hypothetical protein [Pseudoalteromonas sp. DL-6]QBJ62641.1 hypothetical protein B1F84_06160 [Pseudoalteromonas sp. DL-6]
MKYKLLVALVDQFAFSISSFLFFLYMAKFSTIESLGIFSICIALAVFFQGVQRNLIIIPMMTSKFSYSLNKSSYFYSLSFIASLIASLFALLVFYVYSLFSEVKLIINSGFIFLYVIFSWYYEYKKRTAWLLLNYNKILWSVFFLIFSLVILSWLLIESDFISYSYPLSLLFASLPFGKKEKLYNISCLKIIKRFKSKQYEVCGGFLYGFYNNFLIIFAGALLGPVAAGVYAVARNLLQPVQVLISAIDSFDKKDLAKRYYSNGLKALRVSIFKATLICISLSLTYYLLVVYNYSIINSIIFQGKFDDLEYLITLCLLAYTAMIFGHFLENGLYICSLGKNMFTNRFFASVLALITLFFTNNYMGYFAVPFAMLIGWLVIIVLTLRLLILKDNHEN